MITRKDTFHFLMDNADERLDSLYNDFINHVRTYVKCYPVAKKMKSKSKQSRYVRVVMKGEWK